MRLMHSIKRTIEISRPICWPTTFFGFILGTLFSHHPLTPLVLFFAFLWSFPYSLWICTVNDLSDKETDKVNAYKGGVAGAKIDTEEIPFIKKLQWISLGSILIPVLLTGNYVFYLTAAVALTIPYIYSVKPIRLKERPPLDSLSNGATAVFIFLSGYVFNQPVHMERVPWQALLGLFFGISAFHVIGALRDYTPDKKTNTRTIAVVWGQRWSAVFSMCLFILLSISIFNFPLELRLCGFIGIICTLVLTVKPSEKMSFSALLIIVVSFFIASAYYVIGLL